jgi:endonuclease/exonuclease/phosphatase family metal-dependent hydrolase
MEQLESGSFLPPGSPSVPETIRIVSWNINRGLQLDGVIGFLRSAAADLILLQETDVNAWRTKHRNIAREIAQALRMNYVFGREFEELTQGDHNSPAYHGHATLSRLPLLESRVLRFHRQSGFWRPRWFVPNIQSLQRRVGARMALVSHVPWFEKHLVLYNVHLESRGNDELRCGQLVEILHDSQQYDDEVPVVIAGDFNFDLSQEPAASLLVGSPFNRPSQRGSARPTTTPSPLGRARTVDWILTRGPLACVGAELHDSVLASDHYPLSLTLEPTLVSAS